jgi:hypothetical protein
VNDAIFPEPLAARPIDVVLFVQLNVVPATEPVKFTGAVGAPLHTVWLAGWVTSGVGLTITVAVVVAPVQLPDTGVIVKVTVTGEVVLFVKDPLILPVPLAAMPVAAAKLSLVQLYTVPAIGLPLNTIVVIADPEQIACEEGVAVAVGVPIILRVTSPTPGELYAIPHERPAGSAGKIVVANVPTRFVEVIIL